MRLGSDPELFLTDKNGNPLAVCGMIGADKWNPMQVPNLPQGFTWQEDNVALEFGIPPAASAEEFIAHIKTVQADFFKKKKHLSFSKLSCIVFPDEQMTAPASRIFGCEPDYNAWTGKVNKKPEPPVPNMRSAGGHIHVETDLDKRSVIQAMDLYLGVPSVLMDAGKDRRKLYGKYGAYRSKPYGVEYRVLSNFWIFEDKHIKWVWENTERALDAVKQKLPVKDLQQYIRKAINEGNKKEAQALVHTCNLEVV